MLSQWWLVEASIIYLIGLKIQWYGDLSSRQLLGTDHIWGWMHVQSKVCQRFEL